MSDIEVSESILEMVLTRETIGSIRGNKELQTFNESISSTLFKFKGFAFNLSYQQSVDSGESVASIIDLEFVLSVLPDLAWSYEEIYFEGELISDNLSSGAAILRLFPTKLEAPATVSRAKLFEESLKGTWLSKIPAIFQFGGSKGGRTEEMIKEEIITYETMLASFHNDRVFRWQLLSHSEAGIRGEQHFFLFISPPKTPELKVKIDLRAVARERSSEKRLRLELSSRDRKKERIIPIIL